MSETRTLKVIVVGNSTQAQAALKELGAASEAAGAKAGSSFGVLGKKLETIGGRVKSVGSTMTHMFTLPVVAAGAVSVDLATKFNSAMTRIQTQAGASARDVKVLSDAVLKLAPSTQQGPVELADSLYHLKSVGMDNADAMSALKNAADLANVSGAGLEDTTNALAGAWRSGIKGATSFKGAIGTLNAIVGAGNMRMADLNAAMGTGFLPSAKTFGISLREAGGALALMTDEGIPANAAATRLRMTFSMLGAPSDKAAKAMQALGINSHALGETLQGKGGLVGGLQMIRDHLKGLDKAGKAQALSSMFGGGRSSSAIMTMMNNFDVLKKKIKQVNDTAGRMGDEIKKQAKTPEAQFKTLVTTLETAGVKLGNVLLPFVIKVAQGITKLVTKFQSMSPTFQKFAGIAALVAAALGPILIIAGSLITVVGALLTPVGAWIAALVLVGIALVALYKHSAQFRQIVSDAFAKVKAAIAPVMQGVHGLVAAFIPFIPVLKKVGGFLLTVFGSAVLGLIDGVVNVIEGVIKVLTGLLNFIHGVFTGNWSQAWQGIKQIFFGLLQAIWGAIEIYWNGSILGAFRHGIVAIIEAFTGGWKGIIRIWKAGSNGLKDLAGKIIEFVTRPFRAAFKGAMDFVKTGWKFIKGEFTGGIGSVTAVLRRIIQVWTYPYRVAWSLAKSVVTDGWGVVKGLFSDGVAAVGRAIGKVPGIVKNACSGAITWLVDAGKNIIKGIISGITSEVGALMGTVSGLKDKITGAFHGAMKIFSPSRVMAESGKWVTLGIAKGIGDPRAVREVTKAIRAIASQIMTAFKDHKITSGEKDGLLGYLHAKTEAYGKAIAKVDRLTDKMNAAKDKLDKAKAKLQAIQSNKSNLIQATASQVNDYGGFMNTLGDGTAGNQNDPQSILARFKSRLANIKAFHKNISALAHDGLSNAVLNQILAAGPDEGGQMAAALLADTSVIQSLNRTQRDITSEAHSLGLQAGNRTYNAAIRAQAGVVHEEHKHYVDVKVEVKGAVHDEKKLAAEILKYVRDGLARDEKRNGRKKKK